MIKGLVRTGTLIAVGGRPGAGKTALMVAIADALDKGEPFLGRETKETTVAYIAAEDGGDVANRLEAIGNTSIKIVDSPEGFPNISRAVMASGGSARAAGGGAVTVSMPITIDARGADEAGLARVQQQLAQLRGEIPRMVVTSVANAKRRNVQGI